MHVNIRMSPQAAWQSSWSNKVKGPTWIQGSGFWARRSTPAPLAVSHALPQTGSCKGGSSMGTGVWAVGFDCSNGVGPRYWGLGLHTTLLGSGTVAVSVGQDWWAAGNIRGDVLSSGSRVQPELGFGNRYWNLKRIGWRPAAIVLVGQGCVA